MGKKWALTLLGWAKSMLTQDVTDVCFKPYYLGCVFKLHLLVVKLTAVGMSGYALLFLSVKVGNWMNFRWQEIAEAEMFQSSLPAQLTTQPSGLWLRDHPRDHISFSLYYSVIAQWIPSCTPLARSQRTGMFCELSTSWLPWFIVLFCSDRTEDGLEVKIWPA